jgi:uncharacterized membrane protein
MNSMLTLARRAATAALTAALTLGVVSAVPSTAQAAPVAQSASVSASSAAKVASEAEILYFQKPRRTRAGSMIVRINSRLVRIDNPKGVVKVTVARRTGKVVIRKTEELVGARTRQFNIRKLRKGRYTVTARYLGDDRHRGDSVSRRFRVR